jgi:hypothetical protein
VPRTHVQSEVEQLDQERGLPDVDANDVAVLWVDLQQAARPAPVGVFESDLDDDTFRFQGDDKVAHCGGTQPRLGPDLLPRQRTAEEDLPQGAGPVALAEVPHGGCTGPGHRPA